MALLRMRRLSGSQGSPSVRPQPYGDTDELGRGDVPRRSQVPSPQCDIGRTGQFSCAAVIVGRSSEVARPRKLWLRNPGAPE